MLIEKKCVQFLSKFDLTAYRVCFFKWQKGPKAAEISWRAALFYYIIMSIILQKLAWTYSYEILTLC